MISMTYCFLKIFKTCEEVYRLCRVCAFPASSPTLSRMFPAFCDLVRETAFETPRASTNPQGIHHTLSTSWTLLLHTSNNDPLSFSQRHLPWFHSQGLFSLFMIFKNQELYLPSIGHFYFSIPIFNNVTISAFC